MSEHRDAGGGDGQGADHDSRAARGSGADGGSRGLPTGLKVLFGCLGVFALGAILLAVTVGVGGVALKRGIENTVGSFEEHREASDALARLERDHPFEVPAHGAVTEEHVDRFLAVTERAWDEVRPWAEEVEAFRARAATEDGVRLRDALTGARAVGGVGRSRVALAEALEAEGVSLGEYAWTGLTLERAAEASRGGGPATGVPPGNLRLVSRYADTLPDFESDEPGPSTVLAVATLWALSEATTWSALGLDTLGGR